MPKADATQIKQLFQNLIQNALNARNKDNLFVKVTMQEISIYPKLKYTGKDL